MKLEIHHSCDDFDSYRAARVKSLFNVETGANFDLEVELPIDGDGWKLGVVHGPSGSGKTSIGHRIFGDRHVYKAPAPAPDANPTPNVKGTRRKRPAPKLAAGVRGCRARGVAA